MTAETARCDNRCNIKFRHLSVESSIVIKYLPRVVHKAFRKNCFVVTILGLRGARQFTAWKILAQDR